jgi:hypothetical protein
MKKLVFAALLLGGLSQATGCIIVSDDDDTVDSSTFLVEWNLETALASPPGAITCADAGVDTIRTVSEPTGGAQIIDLFDCTDGVHETAPLPLGDYLVWTDAVDSTNGDLLVAQSFSQEETLFDANPVGVDFTFPVDAGYLALTWTLTEDTTPPTALTCADVGGDGVSVLATEVGGSSTGYDEIFACTDGSSGQISFDQRTALPIMDYTVVVSLLDDQDNVLGMSEARSVGIDFGNELEDLGNFDFAFAPQ